MTAATLSALQRALAEVAAGATARDREPAFPADAMTALARAGALGQRAPISEEWELVRAVAQADGSVGRIVDGHYNAVERIELLADGAAAQRPPRGGRGRAAMAGRVGRRPDPRRRRAGPRRARRPTG